MSTIRDMLEAAVTGLAMFAVTVLAPPVLHRDRQWHPQETPAVAILPRSRPPAAPGATAVGLVPAFPAGDGFRFICRGCGCPAQTAAEGPPPEPGRIVTAGCGGCGEVARCVMRLSVFGRTRQELAGRTGG